MMGFLYTEDAVLPETFPCRCVLSMEGERARTVYAESCAIGYPQALWSHRSGICVKPEENRSIQIHTIRRMLYKQAVYEKGVS